MSTIEYNHSFISSLVIGNNFDIDEFENFTARVNSSTIPLFKDLDYPWDICFEINEKNKLVWMVIEYEYGRHEDCMFDSGTIAMNGGIEVVFGDTPSYFQDFQVCDDYASEFIACLFPEGSEIIQLYPDQNMFLVNKIFYNFDTMMGTGTDKHIHLEFISYK